MTGNSITVEELVALTEYAVPAVPCSVLGCLEEGRDRHHIAPGSRFGEERERWPIVRVCRWHHIQMHVMLSGYIWGGLRFIDNLSEYRVHPS